MLNATILPFANIHAVLAHIRRHQTLIIWAKILCLVRGFPRFLEAKQLANYRNRDKIVTDHAPHLLRNTGGGGYRSNKLPCERSNFADGSVTLKRICSHSEF